MKRAAEPVTQAVLKDGSLAKRHAKSNRNRQLCKSCRSICFYYIFPSQYYAGRPSLWGTVRKQITPSEESSCPLCQFFFAMRNFHDLTPDEGDDHEQWYLRAFSAKYLFGLSKGTKLLDTTFLAVVQGRYSYMKERTNAFTKSIVKFILPTASLGISERECFTGRQLNAMVDFDLLRSWMEICSLKHRRVCSRSAFTGHPLEVPKGLRVIDCSTRAIIPAPPECSYVALSYLWGPGDNGKEAENAASTGQLPTACPLVIEDAISVTKGLHFQYLWVDRYCINQQDKEDKHNQIANMDGIYSLAELTIIAAAGDGPTYGLPGVSQRLRTPQPSLRLDRGLLVSSLHNPRGTISSSPWMKRAWTYQEGHLSRRRLVFTEEQVYFQCLGMHCFESISMPIAMLEVRDGQMLQESLKRYRLFPNVSIARHPADLVVRINEYAGRDLSYESDRLNAFLGILKAFERLQAHRPTYHFWGVPLFNQRLREVYCPSENAGWLEFSCGLAWDIRVPGKRRHEFCSWSWIGWSDWSDLTFEFVSTNRGYAQSFKVDPTPLDIQVQLKDGSFIAWSDSDRERPPDQFNTTGRLCITGMVSALRLRRMETWRSFAEQGSRWRIFTDSSETNQQGHPFGISKLSFTGQVTEQEDELNALGLLLFRGEGESGVATYLILKEEGDHYTRLGIASLRAILGISDGPGLKLDTHISSGSPCLKIQQKTIVLG